MGGISAQLSTLITALSEQRTTDSTAVANRISGVDAQLKSLSDSMAHLVTAVNNLTASKGNGKGGPYGKDAGQGQGKAKTLVQAPDTTNDAAMDTNNSEQLQIRSVQSAEA